LSEILVFSGSPILWAQFHQKYPMKKLIISLSLFVGTMAFSQSNGYWQQHVDYKMDVVMDVKNYQYKGKQQLVYTNNSPDTLRRVFYHLYNNAFQPNSEMDARLLSIADPDRRMVTKTKVGDKEVKKAALPSSNPMKSVI
jgi:hypothetical protein